MRVTGACDYNHTFSDQKRLELLKKGSAPWALQLENRSHGPGIIKQAQPKTGFLENGLHDGVVAQHLCDNPVQLLVVRDRQSKFAPAARGQSAPPDSASKNSASTRSGQKGRHGT